MPMNFQAQVASSFLTISPVMRTSNILRPMPAMTRSTWKGSVSMNRVPVAAQILPLVWMVKPSASSTMASAVIPAAGRRRP